MKIIFGMATEPHHIDKVLTKPLALTNRHFFQKNKPSIPALALRHQRFWLYLDIKCVFFWCKFVICLPVHLLRKYPSKRQVDGSLAKTLLHDEFYISNWQCNVGLLYYTVAVLIHPSDAEIPDNNWANKSCEKLFISTRVDQLQSDQLLLWS